MIKEMIRSDIEASIKMAKLDGIGLKHKCELFLPPFQDRHNPFFVILKKVVREEEEGLGHKKR